MIAELSPKLNDRRTLAKDLPHTTPTFFKSTILSHIYKNNDTPRTG